MPLTHNIGQSRPPISVSQVMPYESKEDISLLYVDNACTKDQILCKCPYSKIQSAKSSAGRATVLPR